MKSLAYFPYLPIELIDGKVTVIETASNNVYKDLLTGFRNGDDTIAFSNTDSSVVDTNSVTDWFGDLELEVNLDKLFQRLLIKRLINVLSDQASVELLDAARELLRQILEDSFSLDIPLEVGNLPSMEQIIKFGGLTFSKDALRTAYDKLEVLLRTVVELEIGKTPVLTNLSHYLDVNQFTQLAGLMTGLDIPCVVIEFSSVNRYELYSGAQYIWIDSDFNDSRGER